LRGPLAVRILLMSGSDLKGKGVAVLERGSAVETETRNPQNRELHHQFIALLAARVVAGRLVNGGHFGIRKGGGVEACRLMRVLVEPEADRVLWFHVACSLFSIQTTAAGLRLECIGRIRRPGIEATWPRPAPP